VQQVQRVLKGTPVTQEQQGQRVQEVTREVQLALLELQVQLVLLELQVQLV
jgi:signal recognition particle GTPase